MAEWAGYRSQQLGSITMVRRDITMSTLALNRTQICFGLLPFLAFAFSAYAGPNNRTTAPRGQFVSFNDPLGDETARPTDPGGTGIFDSTAHRLVDLRKITLGTWSPLVPSMDLFTGTFNSTGEFMLLQLEIVGLVNPPGHNDPFFFNPFQYGPHPIYGFVEIDMDQNLDSGGEIIAPEYRYLSNLARFGGQPNGGYYLDRIALNGAAIDTDFQSQPHVERSGEEFHLALLGGQFNPTDIFEIAGDNDLTFESGETWNILGRWLHRSHGFEPYSLAWGGSVSGEYVPTSFLQFRHDPTSNRTFITLVLPLTNFGSSLVTGLPPQPLNGNASDQASVLEGLADLVDSAEFLQDFPTREPEEAIIYDWAGDTAADYLNPLTWRVTALLGSTYDLPISSGQYFVWTDIYPNVFRGDVNGEYGVNSDDRDEINSFIAATDGQDGSLDGATDVAAYPYGFSIFDLNYDGTVDAVDSFLAARSGDSNDDAAVDLADYCWMQNCFARNPNSTNYNECLRLDFNLDDIVDHRDYLRFRFFMMGPTKAAFGSFIDFSPTYATLEEE